MPKTENSWRAVADIRRDLDTVCIEIAEIDVYLEGSLQRRDATYRKKDGTLVKHKATPSLQYPTGSGQGRMRIPWEYVEFVEELISRGTHRKELLVRHRDLARELAATMMHEGADATSKKKAQPR